MKYFLILFILVLQSSFFAQSDAARLQRLINNDSSSAQLLLNYPDSIREAVLTVAQYPEALQSVNQIQNSSSRSFQSLLANYSDEREKQLWDISRFPELSSKIIDNRGKSRKELKSIFSNYENHTKRAAIHFARHDNNTIVQMRNIQKEFNLKYHEALKNYPANVKSSFDVLLRYPELASTFSQDTSTTKNLGKLYSQNPGLVKNVLDSASKQLSKDYDQEYADWKNGISSNPKVVKDMKGLSKEYKKQSKNYEDDDVYATGKEENVQGDNSDTEQKTYYVNNYYVNPYPYWAGYPNWYFAPYWYPYPWWWSMGFYWYPNRPYYFYGMPSYHFGYWYYYHPRNYYNRYPHAGNYFYQHQQRYPRSNSGINRAVRDWNGGRRTGGGGYQGGGRSGGGFPGGGRGRGGGGFPGGGGGGGGRRR